MPYPSPAEIYVAFPGLLDKAFALLCSEIVSLFAGAETSKETDVRLICLPWNNPKQITPRGRK